MITQIILNFFRDLIVDWIDGWPELPPELLALHDEFDAAVDLMNSYVSTLGVIIPFNTINQMVSLWLIVFGFWMVLLVSRFVAWAADR